MMNLAELQEAEAHRRLKLLGTTIEDASGADLRKRSRQVDIPVAVLRQWHTSYLHRGFDALLPSWSDISEPVWTLIEQRYAALGSLAEAETFSKEDMCALATRQRWTMLKLADYYGKIWRIMLHKLQIAGQSTRFAPIACDTRAFTERLLAHVTFHSEPFSTPDGSVKHHMAVKSASLNHIVAILAHFCSGSSKKCSTISWYPALTTHCHDMLHKSYSLPTYATGHFIACLLQTGF